MRLEFDPAKDAINRVKHGISLAAAANMELENAVLGIDSRFDYGEVRRYAIGFIGTRLHYLIFTTPSDGAFRAVSLRKANSKEIRTHERNKGATAP